MEDKITISMENLTNEEREQLMKLVKKASEGKESKIWKPKDGQEYYTICNGEICIYNWNGIVFDEYIFAVGDVFRTREEAVEEVKRRKFLTQWKRLSIEAGEDENEWNRQNKHFYVIYDLVDKALRIEYWFSASNGSSCFPSMESIKNAIEIIGEKNVIKYVLGVKE